jgi:DNA-directed RNA polymerase subunit RPC12/RpoP
MFIKCYDVRFVLDVHVGGYGRVQFPSLHGHEEKLRCPYKGCEKTFEKPTVLTDTSSIPRESYYACPFCMSKIDIVTEKMKVVTVKATEYPPMVFDSPAKCAHFSGLLGIGNSPLPDECLVCPKVLQCDARKK